MKHLMKKALLAAGLMLAPALSAMIATPVEAHGGSGVSVSVTIPTRSAVFGFSYGNPVLYGHVHAAPVYCTHGPLYYYPAYNVYGHYHPRLRYYNYARPVYYYAPPPVHHYAHPAPVYVQQSHVHHGYKGNHGNKGNHGKQGRGHPGPHDDDDN
jgi:hypothetical protein